FPFLQSTKPKKKPRVANNSPPGLPTPIIASSPPATPIVSGAISPARALSNPSTTFAPVIPRAIPRCSIISPMSSSRANSTRVTSSTPQLPGAKPGQRATQLADSATDTGSGLLATLGRPARQSACECERSSEIRLGSVMALLSGPTISGAINDPTNAIAKLAETEKDDRKLIDDVFLRVLSRPATESEVTNVLALLPAVDTDHIKITNELGPLEVK